MTAPLLRAFGRSAALLACALALSCARTSLEPDCPRGMTLQGEGCVCLTDEGCPLGHACEQALCVCRDSTCCPAGYAYSPESLSCVCGDSACCPKDHRWDEIVSRCICDNQSCCPDGYSFDPAAGGCRCASDQCCPTGFLYSAEKQQCVCSADSCCPLDHRFDQPTKSCICARDSCCPLGYRYEESIGACVCSGNACCPVGFRYDVGTNRCVCTNDASCGSGGVHNRCDQPSGTCRCRDDQGCPQPPQVSVPQYCNPLGFCQSLSCTSDRDCPVSGPNPTFCDITTGTCIPIVACTLDDHCPFGQICNTAINRCASGCRSDSGCPLRQACNGGQCQTFCRDNQFCAQPNQFCAAGSGTCSFQPGRVDCFDCTNNPAVCGNPANATCLIFIAEGQSNRSFCGMACEENADCPAGYECDGVIFGCGSEGSACSDDGTGPVTCKSFNVENEGLQLYCADATGQPHEYFRRCGPTSGFCPASVSP